MVSNIAIKAIVINIIIIIIIVIYYYYYSLSFPLKNPG